MKSEQDIFNEALGKPAGAQRSAFLDEACGGDAELRARIERLVAAHERAGSFLESPPTSALAETRADVLTERPGTQVGAYKLLEQIGEGGMGVVFMAEQQRPVRRRVALKVIKAGMDTRQVVARFEAERQALAMMDHPNIAKVLDAGSTETGRPYVVMELVRGTPITDYCDQHQLSARQRLELFVQVCQAVQHAHQKGIIHRDLKPSNVLVSVADDGQPVPKVIDFGIAKATGGLRLSEQTLFTEFRQLIGTPLYMSPEQAETSALLDLDTRSDVYSLGVLLYELLTGTTPFDKQRLAKAAYDEVKRIIRDEEPPRPSTRLSTLDAERLSAVSAQRHTDPKKLGQLIRGELDWIVMRALEKDRNRRYETASGLGKDVERYLDDEPVSACPPTTAYRVRKVLHRHRKEAAVAGALVALLVLGTVGTSVGMVRSRVLLRRAQAAEKLATDEKNDANKAKERAERQAGRANAVSDFMESMLKSAQPSADHRAEDVRVVDILQTAAESVDRKLKDQPEAEAQVRGTLGVTYTTLGMYDQAEKQLRQAHLVACGAHGEESEQALRIATELIYILGLNHAQEAEALARKCYEISRQRLGEDNELTEGFESNIAGSLFYEHRFAQAAEIYRKLIEKAERRGKAIADDPSLYHDYAYSLFQAGKLEEAEPILRQVIEVQDARPDKVEPMQALLSRRTYGMLLADREKLDEAKRVFEIAIARQQDKLGPTHPETQYTVSIYASVLEAMGLYREALEKHRELLEVGRKLGREEDLGYGWRQVKVATLLLNLGQQEEASRTANDALARTLVKTGEIPYAWLKTWSNALLVSGLGPQGQWKNQPLRANVWCALDEHLYDSPGAGDLVVDAVDWGKLRFRLERWDVSAGAAPPALVAVAGGTLQNLKGLGELEAGVYRLSLDVARPNAKEPQAREAWLLFTGWDLNLYTSAGDAETPDAYHAMLAGKPAEQRRLNTLAISSDEAGAKSGPGGRTEFFALSGSSAVDLPAGRYRFSATSDDGMRLFVDGRLVIDSWVDRSSDRDDAVLDLEAGRHALRVEFFQKGGGWQLWLQLAPAGAAPLTPLPVVGGNHGPRRLARPDPARTLATLTAEVRRRPFSAQAVIGRARFLAGRGRYAESAKDFSDGLKLDPADRSAMVDGAVVALQAGDVEGYRVRCAEMLSRFGASTERGTCEQVVKDCAMSPDAVSEPNVLVEVAGRAVAPGDYDGPDARGWRALAMGMAEYRAGHFAPAVEWLRKAVAPGAERREQTCQFFMAMAESKLGHVGEAEAAFARGRELVDKNGPIADQFWSVKEWIIAVHARDEAAGVLGHPLGPPATRASDAKVGGRN